MVPLYNNHRCHTSVILILVILTRIAPTTGWTIPIVQVKERTTTTTSAMSIQQHSVIVRQQQQQQPSTATTSILSRYNYHYNVVNSKRRRVGQGKPSSSLYSSNSNNNNKMKQNKLPIIDAEHVDTDNDIYNDNDKHSLPPPQPPRRKRESNNNLQKEQLTNKKISSSKSLFDIALESSADYWKDLRVQFIDPSSSSSYSSLLSSSSSTGNTNTNNNIINNNDDGLINYIDVKIAFIASIEGQQYAIAVPYDTGVAIVVEDMTSTSSSMAVQYLSPDNNDNEEIMQIMATRLQESFGTDVFLKRTPRILTISGPFDEKYMTDWQNNVLPQPLSPSELLNTDDETIDYFLQFMKDEVGIDTYNKIMMNTNDQLNDDDDDDELTIALAKAFNINNDNNDVTDIIDDDNNNNDNLDTKIDAAIQAIMNDLDDDALIEREIAKVLKTSSSTSSGSDDTGISMRNQGIAIKLISFILPSKNAKGKETKKAYSLVKLVKPHVLVGRMVVTTSSGTRSSSIDLDDNNNNDPTAYDNIRFDLLSYDEERIIIPKLEAICWTELQDSGLTLPVLEDGTS